MLKPLAEWICDECGQVIASAEEGFVEWLHIEGKPVDVRIVHHAPASPLKRKDGCYAYSDEANRQDMHLTDFVGPDGLAHLLSLIDDGPLLRAEGEKNITPGVTSASWTEAVRRLQLPHYEEARRHFGKAKADGVFVEANELWPYMQANLLGIVKRYAGDED